jgi:hypothetical protein
VIRRALAILAVVTMWLPAMALSAHEVIVDQVIDMVVAPHGDRLLVHLHLPLTVLGDANLPRLAGGLLDPAIGAGRLRAVAMDVARNLDLQQTDVGLPEPEATARVGADRASVDVELQYGVTADSSGFSARLNTLRSTVGPVRTDVRYRLTSGAEQDLRVTGPAVRVTFDPGAREVLQQFAARALRALLDGGDQLLFLLCVLLPLRRARPAAAIFTTAALGQTLAIGVSLVQPGFTADSLTALAMIAASAVVVAALQNVVQASLRWVLLLALGFGLLNGFAFGSTLSASAPFAGSHQWLAVALFTLVVLVGELWLGALAWATRSWLDQQGVPERILSMLASAVIAHSAIHRVADRGHLLAQAGSFSADRALLWLTLGWACVMLLVALAKVLSERGAGSGAALHAAKVPWSS